MIATPTMIFVHLHKTGGQFINRLLLTYVSGARRIGYHLPRSETPEELRCMPALGFVRNPWDWYVSWYAFNCMTPERNPIFRIVSAHGTLGFERTIENLVMLGDPDHKNLRMLIAEQLPATRDTNLGSGITKNVMSRMNEPGRGYVTWIWRYMFLMDGSFTGMTTGRYESLRRDLAECLKQLGISISPLMHHEITVAPAVNPSSHGNYQNYYSDKLREFVAKRDHEYIDYYSYSF